MKRIINTDQAPAAIGAYSQAVEKKGMLFISGQIPVDSASGEIVSTDVKEQTRQSMENLKAILTEADYTLDDVVKCEVFISDMDNFSMVNEVYAEYFAEDEPARACVEVAGLPKDVLVEIAAVAVK
jgi:2-iminobutanoate/2-iminopropanoate deaminase